VITFADTAQTRVERAHLDEPSVSNPVIQRPEVSLTRCRKTVSEA
jgi:hypothetical protein